MIFATKSNFISVVQEHHDTTIPLRPCKTEKPNSFFIDLIFGKCKQFPSENQEVLTSFWTLFFNKFFKLLFWKNSHVAYTISLSLNEVKQAFYPIQRYFSS